jgi:hypothetical protein
VCREKVMYELGRDGTYGGSSLGGSGQSRT